MIDANFPVPRVLWTTGKMNPLRFTTSSENLPSFSHDLCVSLVCWGLPVQPQASVTWHLAQPQCKTAPFGAFLLLGSKKSSEFPVFHPWARLCAHAEPGRGVSPVLQQHVVAWLPSPCGAVTSSHAFPKPLTFCPLNRCFWAPVRNGLILCLAEVARAPVNHYRGSAFLAGVFLQ